MKNIMELTKRQKDILIAIVEQYAEVAVPVGSVTLAKAFNVSSATIRSEMVHLESLGLIEQPHTSAGRIPTDAGYRYFVNNMGDDVRGVRSGREEKAIQSRVESAGTADRAIQTAVKTLVELTGNVGLATIGDSIYVRGLSHLFTQPEFITINTVQQVATLIDNIEPWLRETSPNESLSVYIGEENPVGKTSGCSLVISRFTSPFSDNSYIGVLGPTRQNYRSVMQLVEHAGKVLQTSL